MLKQTVFLPSENQTQYTIVNSAFTEEQGKMLVDMNYGYFLTEEELIELIGNVWEDAGMTTLKAIQSGFLHPEYQSKFKLSDRELIQGIGETIVNYPIPDNDKYIKELLK